MSNAAAAMAQKFTEKSGVKDTTVNETVAPAVTQETVVPTKHEEATVALDREIHQDHYHTSVLPIEDHVVLPEKHKHVVHDVQLKEHQHGDAGALKRLLEEENARFKDIKTEAEAVVSRKEAPTLTGEHVHHHVHELIQPVIQKETVVPTVIHTTIPIREVHHNEAKHHSATSLPPISLNEFQKQGGSLTGREVRTETFAGEPRAAGATTSAATSNVASSTNANVAKSAGSNAVPSTGANVGSSATPSASSIAGPNAMTNNKDRGARTNAAQITPPGAFPTAGPTTKASSTSANDQASDKGLVQTVKDMLKGSKDA